MIIIPIDIQTTTFIMKMSNVIWKILLKKVSITFVPKKKDLYIYFFRGGGVL